MVFVFMIDLHRRAIRLIPFGTAWRTRSFHIWFWPSLAVVAANAGLAAARILPMRSAQETFVLHYSIAVGIDRVGPWYLTFAPAAVGSLVLVVNLFLSLAFLPRDRMISTMIGAATLTLEIGFFAAGALIILLNV